MSAYDFKVRSEKPEEQYTQFELPYEADDGRTSTVAQQSINGQESKYSNEFAHEVEIQASFCSRAYAVFAAFFTSCKEAVFRQARPDFRMEAFEKEYIPGNSYRSMKSDTYDDIRVVEARPPTYYEAFVDYVRTVYEKLVLFFYELFGIDD